MTKLKPLPITPIATPTTRKHIRVNLLSGFLGSGKTTTILHLLKQVPDGERWAVLVNEFGEIGIDGAILETSGAVIKEVAGGCICCVNNLPLQISLNMLIAKAKPDRLLIEPTGLADPANLLDLLTGPAYDGLFDVRAMITLVDARHAQSTRHREDALFWNQLSAADVIVASKNDLACDEDRDTLDSFLQNFMPPREIATRISHGELDREWLDKPCNWQQGQQASNHLANNNSGLLFGVSNAPKIPLLASLPDGEKVLRKHNRNENAVSCGWLFSREMIFDMNELLTLFHDLHPERAKAVMRTSAGNFIFNMQDDVLGIHDLDTLAESRLEIIDHREHDWEAIERRLLAISL